MAGAVSETDSPPWSLVTPLTDLTRNAKSFHLVASDAECAGAAALLGLEGLQGLRADLETRPWRNGVEISGQVRARVTQICGVSLDPFDAEAANEVLVRVVPVTGKPKPKPTLIDIAIDLDGDDPPDESEDGQVDLAAYALEHLALVIDPFPRAPDAVFEPPAAEASASPFAALAGLDLAVRRGKKP